MRFGALLDGEQPLSGARPVVDDVELVFVADAYAARFRVATAGGRRLDQRDDRRLFGDLEFLYSGYRNTELIARRTISKKIRLEKLFF